MIAGGSTKQKFFGSFSVLINDDENGFINFEPGEYFLKLKVLWNNNKEQELIFSSYCEGKLNLEKLEKNVGK